MTRSFAFATHNIFAHRWLAEERLLYLLMRTLPRLGWPDILCLQEVPQDRLDLVREHLADLYHVVSSGDDTPDGYGVLLAAKRASFELRGEPVIHHFDGAGRTKMGRRLVVMKLLHTETRVSVVAATAHLESEPRNTARRAEQLRQCFTALEPHRADSVALLGMDSNLGDGERPPIPEGFADVGADCGPTWFLDRIPGADGDARVRFDRIYLSVPADGSGGTVLAGPLENLSPRGARALSGGDTERFHLSDHNLLLVELTVNPPGAEQPQLEERTAAAASRASLLADPDPIDFAALKSDREVAAARALALAVAAKAAELDAAFVPVAAGGGRDMHLRYRSHMMRKAWLEWNTSGPVPPTRRWDAARVSAWDRRAEMEFDEEVWVWYFHRAVLGREVDYDAVADMCEAEPGIVGRLYREHVDPALE
ncbi:Endonuclease/exonuclease/phosphatase [Hyaloraphidium curvatum]|nr:Endonuclease/exonuclease/phosphatase [Hyaloraphidium curvatum]